MVYFGPSRGCLTCRRRRKKCDEARPSCTRCTTSNRTCGGYEDGPDRIFRRYDGQDGPASPLISIARKCSLPVRVSESGTDKLPEDIRPKEVSEEEREEFALRAFFYDYCIVSTNRSISRGYLDGLESMLRELGTQSDLAKACKVVGYASHGIKLRRPVLTQQAEVMYHELLGSLARAIENGAYADTAESLMVAMLLGLYEMIIAKVADPGNHEAHAKGLAAILQIENSPLDLFGAVHLIRSNHPLLSGGVIQKCSVFSAPSSTNSNHSLDDLLLMFDLIWRKADVLLGTHLMVLDDICLLKDEAMALNQAFAQWQESQDGDFKPRTVGTAKRRQLDPFTAVGHWPGRVDTYFDHFVAGVWNTSRAARILLISLILKLSKILNNEQNHTRENQEVTRLVEDMVASIPYHLAEDMQVFIRDLANNEESMSIEPGRSVGGLLLMHPIYVASKLLIVPPQMRDYLRECLSWIGIYMGIGQASLFAQTPNIHKQYFADGCMIVWAGMLV